MAEGDLATFREKGLKQKMIEHDKRGVADQIFTSEAEVLLTKNPLDSREVAEFKERLSARQEAFNCRIKTFKSMCTRWRHGTTPERIMEGHGYAMRAICAVISYEFEHNCTKDDVVLFDPFPASSENPPNLPDPNDHEALAAWL